MTQNFVAGHAPVNTMDDIDIDKILSYGYQNNEGSKSSKIDGYVRENETMQRDDITREQVSKLADMTKPRTSQTSII